jgi:hypothetical protein
MIKSAFFSVSCSILLAWSGRGVLSFSTSIRSNSNSLKGGRSSTSSTRTIPTTIPTCRLGIACRRSISLFAKSPDSKDTATSGSTTKNATTSTRNKTNLDSNVRSRLLSESIAPWRTLRLFLYTALGSGAALGGFITLSGLAAAIAKHSTDDLSAEYLNIAIDFGAVLAFLLLARWDLQKADELNERVQTKLNQKKNNQIIRAKMKQREEQLSLLNLDIQVGQDQYQTATVEAVQTGGKQHVIIVAGNRKAVRDALLGANLLKMEFAIRDVLIVPYEIGANAADKLIKPDGSSGFANNASKNQKPSWETQTYVAQPVGDGWDEYVKAELDDAVAQNGDKVKDEGIAIVVANTGQIIRRGVGKVPWRNMVEELEKTVKDDDVLDLSFLQG